MKIEVVRNAKGEVLGTVSAPAANEVPIEVELSEGDTLEEVQVRARELLDLAALHGRFSKGARKQ